MKKNTFGDMLPSTLMLNKLGSEFGNVTGWLVLSVIEDNEHWIQFLKMRWLVTFSNGDFSIVEVVKAAREQPLSSTNGELFLAIES